MEPVRPTLHLEHTGHGPVVCPTVDGVIELAVPAETEISLRTQKVKQISLTRVILHVAWFDATSFRFLRCNSYGFCYIFLFF